MRRIVASMTLAAALAGCSHGQHLSEDYAKSFDSTFAAQRATPRDVAPRGPVLGLDSQEASIISNTYRGSLAPKEGGSGQPVLIVAPQNRDARPEMPPPSVPRK